MKKDLKLLSDFIMDLGDKGQVKMETLLELMDAIYRLEDAGN